MLDRSAYLQGGNLGILVAVLITVALGGFISVGPGERHLETVRAEVFQAATRLESWQEDYSSFHPVPAAVRAQWRSHWLAFAERLRPARGDAELTAAIAEGLQAQSVRGLRVSRRPSDSAGAGESESELILQPIGAGAPLVIRPEPVLATLTANYEDARRIIERLESRQLPVRIDSIELKRDFPDVSMQLELVYFVRVESQL